MLTTTMKMMMLMLMKMVMMMMKVIVIPDSDVAPLILVNITSCCGLSGAFRT